MLGPDEFSLEALEAAAAARPANVDAAPQPQQGEVEAAASDNAAPQQGEEDAEPQPAVKWPHRGEKLMEFVRMCKGKKVLERRNAAIVIDRKN